MPTHPDGQHGKNSQIQAKGVGKDSKRHDLDGTPGLSPGSSLISGQVQEFEAGQKAVQNTQRAQSPRAAQVTPPSPPAGDQFSAPDPVTFAAQKVGGNLAGAGTAKLEEKLDWSNWLPILRRLATSPTSSGLLQRAFVERMTHEMNKATGTRVALIRQRDFDARLEQLNGGT